MPKKILTVFIILLSLKIYAQSQIFDLNKKLGRGINMGNMFEAPTETEWGNPFKDDYFQRIAALGFNHVRIPIRWDTQPRTQQTAPFTINQQFLERIKFVVDKALAEKLYVVINMHHHDAIFQNPDAEKTKFLSQWKQISEYFKDYDNRLVFEVMNEPNTNLTPEKWNTFFADALSEIRKVSKTRAVLMGTANWGGLGGASLLKIPKDENLILTIHYYDPFNFTHQGAEWVNGSNPWLGTKWQNTNLERDEIVKQFQYLINFSKQNNIPIHIGEFGAYSKADIESRAKWTNFLARWFETQGFSWAYWEFSAGFGIYNPSTNQYNAQLVDALLKNPLSDPVIVNTTKIYESKFDASDVWNLGVQPQAKATYSNQNNVATVEVTQASNDGWHVQLVRNNISLKKGKQYLVSFDASANNDTPITNYIGRAADPWNAYSGYKSFTVTKDWQSFSYSFVMNENDDTKARIVFDLATKVAKLSFRNLIIQEITGNLNSVVLSTEPSKDVLIYPNPTIDEIYLRNIAEYKNLQIQTVTGQTLSNFVLNGENEKKINFSEIQSQPLMVILSNESKKIIKKIIKY